MAGRGLLGAEGGQKADDGRRGGEFAGQTGGGARRRGVRDARREEPSEVPSSGSLGLSHGIWRGRGGLDEVLAGLHDVQRNAMETMLEQNAQLTSVVAQLMSVVAKQQDQLMQLHEEMAWGFGQTSAAVGGVSAVVAAVGARVLDEDKADSTAVVVRGRPAHEVTQRRGESKAPDGDARVKQEGTVEVTGRGETWGISMNR
jgi:hypothetical protein